MWWLIIDGYNVVAPVAGPRFPNPDWLHRERMQLIDRLANHLDDETRARTCVVFDANAPPPDRPSEYQLHDISIRFAVDHPEADDLIEELIRVHSAPKSLAVVSSDQRIQVAARRRGSTVFDSQDWLDRLMDGRVGLAVSRPTGQDAAEATDDVKPDVVDGPEVVDWMREFGFDDPA
jgi:hypothetical protein